MEGCLMVHLELDSVETAPKRLDIEAVYGAHISRIKNMLMAAAFASTGILAVAAALMLRL
jgi:hypothetical protein